MKGTEVRKGHAPAEEIKKGKDGERLNGWKGRKTAGSEIEVIGELKM